MIKRAVRRALRSLPFKIVKNDSGSSSVLPPDFESRHVEVIEKVAPYTITGPERIQAVIESVRYILKNNIGGALVECGVYKGGSMMAIALALIAEGVTDRDLYLFDTFEGMPKPDERDVDLYGSPASDYFSKTRLSDVSSTWTNASMESVRQAVSTTGYPMDRVHFIKGLVENTLPKEAPQKIALLRLDTDWYQSTMHEMTHLYPRLSAKGIAIIDDYGHFKGARQAVDEYFQNLNMAPFLHRIDYTARLIIKEG